jgi:hypothetical protein
MTHRPELQQLGDGVARVEIAPPLLGVAERHQDLAGADAVPLERLRPGARERDLADRRGGLAVLQLEHPAAELEHGAAECDGARRHHQDVALAAVQLGDVIGERSQPLLLDAPGLRIDQER